MIFLICNKSKCIEIESSDIKLALDEGMILLKEDPEWGNVYGWPKPTSPEELENLKRKVIIGAGEYFEYFEYTPHEYNIVLEYLNNLKV